MKKFLLWTAGIIAAAVLAVSGWHLWELYDATHTISSEIADLAKHTQPIEDESSPQESRLQIDWPSLINANPDIVGWIDIPDSEISFPVVQGADNSWYLNHTYEGIPSIYGAIFMASENDPGMVDDNTLIYGHSTDIGGMFTSLKDFADQGFFDSHPLLWYYTPEQDYRCEIYAFLETDSDSAAYMIGFGDERESIMDQIITSALYTREADFGTSRRPNPLVTLSTCDLNYGYHSAQRLLLSAVVTEAEPVS